MPIESVRSSSSPLLSPEPPPTRIRTRIERRATVEVDIEIPAGVNAYATRVGLIIDAGTRGFMTAADAAQHGLVKIIELPRSADLQSA